MIIPEFFPSPRTIVLKFKKNHNSQNFSREFLQFFLNLPEVIKTFPANLFKFSQNLSEYLKVFLETLNIQNFLKFSPQFYRGLPIVVKLYFKILTKFLQTPHQTKFQILSKFATTLKLIQNLPAEVLHIFKILINFSEDILTVPSFFTIFVKNYQIFSEFLHDFLCQFKNFSNACTKFSQNFNRNFLQYSSKSIRTVQFLRNFLTTLLRNHVKIFIKIPLNLIKSDSNSNDVTKIFPKFSTIFFFKICFMFL